jgi:phage shock protein E
MKRLSFILALCALPILAFSADEVTNVTPDAAAKLLSAEMVTALDVRTAEEFSEGHIRGATNVDIMEKDFSKKLAEVDKSKPVLVYCQVGGRSTRSLSKLKKAGFPKIYHLNEGMKGWIDAGKPVAK